MHLRFSLLLALAVFAIGATARAEPFGRGGGGEGGHRDLPARLELPQRPDARPPEEEPAEERFCFTAAETRERIAADRLAEPFAILRTTAGAMNADAIGAKLCQTGGTLVYEINLLGHDGRLIRQTVDAVTGKPAPRRRR